MPIQIRLIPGGRRRHYRESPLRGRDPAVRTSQSGEGLQIAEWAGRGNDGR